MSQELVVSNSSPLISLERIGRLDLFDALFGTVIVPPAVVQETFGSRTPPDWLRRRSLTQPLDPRIRASTLGPGESEAIGLALEFEIDWIVLDDLPARSLAESMNLPVIGTFGLLLMAKQGGIIPMVKPLADAFLAVDFRDSPSLVASILRQAGELD